MCYNKLYWNFIDTKSIKKDDLKTIKKKLKYQDKSFTKDVILVVEKGKVEAYKENRDILYDNLTAYGYKCVKPDGAFYLFVKALEDDAYKFYERAKKHELLVVPCDDFGVFGYVRIAYCTDKQKVIGSLPAFHALAEEYGL